MWVSCQYSCVYCLPLQHRGRHHAKNFWLENSGDHPVYHRNTDLMRPEGWFISAWRKR